MRHGWWRKGRWRQVAKMLTWGSGLEPRILIPSSLSVLIVLHDAISRGAHWVCDKEQDVSWGRLVSRALQCPFLHHSFTITSTLLFVPLWSLSLRKPVWVMSSHFFLRFLPGRLHLSLHVVRVLTELAASGVKGGLRHHSSWSNPPETSPVHPPRQYTAVPYAFSFLLAHHCYF